MKPLEVRVMGPGSLSSILKIINDIFFVLACVGLGFVCIAGLAVAISMALGPDGAPDWLQAGVDGDWREVGPALLSGVILFLGGAIITLYLRRILATLVKGEPFTKENAPRLRIIAAAVAGLEMGRYLIGGATRLMVEMFGEPDGARMQHEFSISVGAWLAVLVILVLSEIFREGARLREQEQFTI